MAESTAVISGEATNAANQGSVVAPPKFVFGQNMSERIKNASQSVVSSSSSSRENSPKPSDKTDSDPESDPASFKRPADFDDGKQESSEEGGPPSPLNKKEAKRHKASEDDDEPKPFKLKPSILNEVAKNLAGSAKGEPRTLTSPVPKTFGLSTSESSSTETRTGATSPDTLGNSNSTNYFQMFLNQQNDKSDGSNNGSGFVFGRNMGERVMFSEDSKTAEQGEEHSKPDADADATQKSNSPNKGNYIGPKTLAEVAESCADAEGPKVSTTSTDKCPLTLAEAAQVYQETASPHTKVHFAKVAKVTGEEEERNVLQINCRLFLFDVSKHSWKEKGRGVLRLNDMCQSMSESIFQSRLVMRNQGNLLVMLNTKLWPEMTLEKANEKSLRVTAVDAVDNEIKIYLIMAGTNDIQQLFTAIDRRIQALKRSQNSQHGDKQAESANTSPSQPNDTDKDSSADIEDDENSTKDRRISGGPDESSNDSCSGPCGSAATKDALSDDE